MVSIIDWLEEDRKHNFCAITILEAMSATGIEKYKKFDSSNLEVDFKINGVDTDFKAAMDHIQSQLEEYKERVRKEVKEEVKQDIIEQLQNLELN